MDNTNDAASFDLNELKDLQRLVMQAQMRPDAPIETGYSYWASVPAAQQDHARTSWAEAQQDARDGKFYHPVNF